MCTLTLAWQTFPDAPVLAAANRDERTDRRSEPPQVETAGPVRIVAPRDERAGGTWVGCNDRGLYVTITNRWLESAIDGERSRGALVDDCLRCESAREAVTAAIDELEARTYNGCHLVIADESAAFVVANDGGRTITRLDPGIHVVGNVGGVLNGRDRFEVPDRRVEVGTRQRNALRRLFETLRPEHGEPSDQWLDRAGETLGDHEFGVCLHEDGFGTRSSSLVRLDGRPSFRYADGPPCSTAYEPIALPTDWGNTDRD